MAEQLSQEVLSLPIGPHLEENAQRYIAGHIERFMKSSKD